ncbi:MAG: hypothetical protein GF401_01595 [Chitinivibrionales bacterium]|nr:hypothetical protein [Chitinivibrionales bacterium]
MKRRVFLIAALALFVGSCARDDQRAPRYDEKQCPVCSSHPGVCFYCKGSTKCHFCDGVGKRKTVTPDIPTEGIEKSSYVEECPYCKGSGVCRYCEGNGKCWACDGNGRVENWDFYEKHKKEHATKKAQEKAIAEKADLSATPSAQDSAPAAGENETGNVEPEGKTE